MYETDDDDLIDDDVKRKRNLALVERRHAALADRHRSLGAIAVRYPGA